MTTMSTPQKVGTDRHGQRASQVGAALALALIPLAALCWRLADSRTALAFLWAAGLSFAVQVVVVIHLRLIRREDVEALERKALAARSAERDSALFESGEIDLFSAARSRRQYERYFVPVFSVLLAVGQAAAAYVVLRTPPADLETASLPAALAIACAVVAFVFGRYAAALSAEPALRPMRASGGQWLFAAVLGAATGAAAAASADAVGIPAADRWVSLAAGIAFALLAFEGLMTLVLEPYRPRAEGDAMRPLYESRLLDLLAQPAGVIRTAADALDYQFGFRISETWFYRFIARAFLPLLLFQLLALYILSCVVYVAPDEVALLERFGRRVPERAVLDPGLHLKWPWPIESAWRYPARRVLLAKVGMAADDPEGSDDHDHDADETPEVVLWSSPHGHEMRPYVVASRDAQAPEDGRFVPVNLLSVHAVLQYRISDVNRFAYEFADGREVVEALARKEVSKQLITVDYERFLGSGFGEVAAEVGRRIQQRCDEVGLGIEVVYFSFENVHPPTPVATEYEKVFAAQQAKEAEIFRAETARAAILPDAEAQAQRIQLTASAEAYRIGTTARAAADEFLNRLEAYHAAPEVYRLRSFLGALRRGLETTRKIVVAARGSQVFILDFQQKVRPDLLDIPLTRPSEGEKP